MSPSRKVDQPATSDKSVTTESSESTKTRRPARRRRNRPEPAIPLGSLTQVPAKEQRYCHACGSNRVTSMAMTLTDGTPVQFTSCHKCEVSRWDHNGEEMSKEDVLHKTRKS